MWKPQNFQNFRKKGFMSEWLYYKYFVHKSHWLKNINVLLSIMVTLFLWKSLCVALLQPFFCVSYFFHIAILLVHIIIQKFNVFHQYSAIEESNNHYTQVGTNKKIFMCWELRLKCESWDLSELFGNISSISDSNIF